MRQSQLRKVVVVFKTHFDLGFTALPDEVMALYTGPMFEAVRQVIAATSASENLGYRWTLPAWPLRQLLHDPAVPAATRDEARRLVAEGRLHWHAYPFTTHTAFCGLEDLVRGLHVSRSLSEEFGRWPTAAKQTDVPGHTWALPSLLVRAGITFLHLGCNSGSHAPHVPRLFWWEGPDGSRLLTYYSQGGYGTSLLPPEGWHFDTWLALQHTFDNEGPQDPEEIERMRARLKQEAPGVELVVGELGDFAESLMKQSEQLDHLPTVRQDLADTWIHGVGTMPREVARVRALRGKLLQLEKAVADHEWPRAGWADTESLISMDFPLARQVAPLIDSAYEQLLLFGEHTWGLDVKSTIKRVFGERFTEARMTEPYKILESSWAAKAAYVDRAEAFYEQAHNIARQAIQPAEEQASITESKAVEDRQWQQRSADTRLRLERFVLSSPPNVLENDWLRLEVDPESGGIVSLINKKASREWVDRTSPEPFGGYRYDIYSAHDIAEFMRAYGTLFQDWFVHDFGKQGYPEDLPHITAYARDFILEKQEDEEGRPYLLMRGGRLRATNGADAQLPQQEVSIKITLSTAYIDIEYIVEGKEAVPLAESTTVPFPLNITRPQYRLGQTGSVIDPHRSIVPGANHNLWCADWLDISRCLGIILRDMPLVSIGSTGIFQFRPKRVPRSSLVYAHLSNTQWGTNFPQWLEGDFRWRVTLDAYEGSWRSVDFCTEADNDAREGFDLWFGAWNFPVHAIDLRLHMVSARPRHDGRGMVVRLWDRVGKARTERVLIEHAPEVTVWRCDLMERPIERLETRPVKGYAQLELSVRPYAIETLLIEFGRETDQ